MKATVPESQQHRFSTPFSQGTQIFHVFRPWLGFDDADNVLFARCLSLQLGCALAARVSSSASQHARWLDMHCRWPGACKAVVQPTARVAAAIMHPVTLLLSLSHPYSTYKGLMSPDYALDPILAAVCKGWAPRRRAQPAMSTPAQVTR